MVEVGWRRGGVAEWGVAEEEGWRSILICLRTLSNSFTSLNCTEGKSRVSPLPLFKTYPQYLRLKTVNLRLKLINRADQCQPLLLQPLQT